MTTLTPEAKQLLSRTVRELRTLMLRALEDSAEQRYRLSLPPGKAKLSEELRKKRERLETWLDERVRTTNPKDKKGAELARGRFLGEAIKEAAATLLNRLVLLRHLEALGLSKPAVLTGGWSARGYQELREFAPGLCGDETEGYAALLGWVFDELALDIPGLFGDVGLTRLFPAPSSLLREVVQRLDDPGLAPAWTDDTTLGWVYQYWNDPEREALDLKIKKKGKIEPHEIASKTQMFTERYMVEWLLQNSLGLTWLCMCKKHGWTPDAEQVLPLLDTRRADWRKKRDAGEVPLDALMPIEGELEELWKYYVPQPIPDDAVAKAPDAVRGLKLLDPACGSGHFLVIAFDLLAAMYREEARHLGKEITDREIAESILENNLHGIDIDPRAVQIAAAAVVLKAKRLAPDARPKQVNLVAPVLRLGNLPPADPALVRLRHDLKAEAGIPAEMTDRLVNALAGVDHLGSLLKVDAAVDDAIRDQERASGKAGAGQGDLLSGKFPAQQAKIDWTAARATLLERLETFLAHHAGEEDLGLRLDGEQLAAGVRFVRIAKEGAYDVVVGNPPYHGTAKLADAEAVRKRYPQGAADLFACFMMRGIQLIREEGILALATLANWMYLRAYSDLRAILAAERTVALADLGVGAFGEGSALIRTACSVFQRSNSPNASVAICPRQSAGGVGLLRPAEIAESLVVQEERFEFAVRNFEGIPERPVMYSWPSGFLEQYVRAPKLGGATRIRKGVCTCDDVRYVRKVWEVRLEHVHVTRSGADFRWDQFKSTWLPTVMGGDGLKWMEPLRDVVRWRDRGLEMKLGVEARYGVVSKRVQSESLYMEPGIAFAMVGRSFSARAHRFRSIFGNKGSSVFAGDIPGVLCLLNGATARYVLESLNPGIGFEVGDVSRLPLLVSGEADSVFATLDVAFSEHESGCERSVEMRTPRASPWRAAQEWAQRAADRPAGEALPRLELQYDAPEPAFFVSFAVGVALGRFGAAGEGVLDEAPKTALPGGILYVSAASERDSLSHAACAPLHVAWAEHGKAVGEGDDLRTWLRTGFFKHHKTVYENRPIYFPLSSAKKSFVAWVSIHRWAPNTLTTLLADHLVPEKRRLEGELDDLRKAKSQASKGKGGAEKRFADVQKLHEELTAFMELVEQCAERGPPPTAPDETKREQDARFEMDLDDGVMVNSAALWPLLEPQWKEPKKWWAQLVDAEPGTDYGWAHLAKRYFPKRVEEKCVDDPSLAVAHGCFWRLHPAKAFAWELRLQDEIRPDFTIDEEGSDAARKKFLKEHAKEAKELEAKEQQRRERKARKAGEEENMELALGEGGDGDGEADE